MGIGSPLTTAAQPDQSAGATSTPSRTQSRRPAARRRLVTQPRGLVSAPRHRAFRRTRPAFGRPYANEKRGNAAHRAETAASDGFPGPVTRRVTGTGVPPVAMTRISTLTPTTAVGAKTRTPSRLQVHRRDRSARRARTLRGCCYPDRSVSVCRGQKSQGHGHPAPRTDSCAPSVPGSCCAVSWSSGRTQSRDRPSAIATNASCRPSADSANETGSLVGGVGISKRAGKGSGTTRRRNCVAGTANAAASRNENTATLQANRKRAYLRLL